MSDQKNKSIRSIPALLAVVGIALIAIGSVGSFLPPRIADLIRSIPVPTAKITRYPDASIVFLEAAAGGGDFPVSRDIDFAVTMTNQPFIESLRARGIKWRILQSGQPDAAELEKLSKPPATLFVKPLGGVRYELLVSRPLPKSVKDANAMIAEVMAK